MIKTPAKIFTTASWETHSKNHLDEPLLENFYMSNKFPEDTNVDATDFAQVAGPISLQQPLT